MATYTGKFLSDNVATDLLGNSFKSEVVDFAISDHDGIQFSISNSYAERNVKNSSIPAMSYRPIAANNIDGFVAALDTVDWNVLLSTGDANEIFGTFLRTFLMLYYEHFPKKIVKHRALTKKPRLPDWTSAALLNLKKWKLLAYDIYRRSHTPEAKKRYLHIKRSTVKV